MWALCVKELANIGKPIRLSHRLPQDHGKIEINHPKNFFYGFPALAGVDWGIRGAWKG